MSRVTIFMYDISGGMAKTLAPAMLGIQMDAIYHTSVVVYNKEYYFDGGVGVERVTEPGTSRFGRPIKTDEMGTTNKTEQEFQNWLSTFGRQNFGPADYNLLQKNCNHFSSAAVRFLFDNAKDIPEEVTSMIPRLLSTPLGAMFRPMLEQMMSPGQSEQQQLGMLQQQFQNQQQQQQRQQQGGAAASSSSSSKQVDEPAWEKLVGEIEAKPASQSLNAILWVDNILGSRTPVYPNQSGTSAAEQQLIERVLACVGYEKDQQQNSSMVFRGNDDTKDMAKMLVGSLLGDLEVRWSTETSA